MSALAMPGMATDIDIQGMIDKLMEVKKAPVERFQEEIDEVRLQDEIWNTVRTRLRELTEATRRLYDYTNPFRVMVAESSLPRSFTADAGRSAEKSRRRVQVLETAQAHRMSSDSIERDKRLPGSVFTVLLDGEEARIDFSQGGTLAELNTMFELAAKEVVRTSFVFDTSTTGILVLEGVKSGEGMWVDFSGDVSTLESIGLIRKNTDVPSAPEAETPAPPADGEVYRHDMQDRGLISPYSGPGNYRQEYTLQDGVLELSPGSRVESRLPAALDAADQLVIEMQVRVQVPTQKTDDGALADWIVYDPDSVKLGPDDPVSIEDVDIFGAPLIPNEKDFEQKRQELEDKKTELEREAEKYKLLQPAVFALAEQRAGTKREYKLHCEDVHDVWQTISRPFDSFPGLSSAGSFIFINDNPKVSIAFRNVRVFSLKSSEPDKQPEIDPSDRVTDYVARNLMDSPRDAEVRIDGIRAQRPVNDIDDLITGVTLRLQQPGEQGLLTIDHDYNLIKEFVFEFVKKYNDTQMYLEAISRHMTRDEREGHEKRMKGMTDLERALEDKEVLMMDRHRAKLAGDQNIARLLNSMRLILMDFYVTRLGRELGVLSQLGISTGPAGARREGEEAKGMLELDMEKLTAIINRDVVAAAQIFGRDSSGDSVVDNGVAKKLDDLIRVYIQPGNSGIIAVRLQGIQRLIRDKNATLVRMERSVEEYEKDLRRRFGSMESRVNTYRSQGRWLEQQQGR